MFLTIYKKTNTIFERILKYPTIANQLKEKLLLIMQECKGAIPLNIRNVAFRM